MAEPDRPDRLSSPTIFLVRMAVFLLLAAFLAFILQKEIGRAFSANPGLNGTILGVLALGCILALREVIRLYREIAYVNRLGDAADDGKLVRAPVLLAPLARLLHNDGADLATTGTAARFSTTTWRAVMDSLATRLDEGRETLRYITGLLIFLGLLGTFWGLLETVGSIGTVINALQGNADSGVMFEDLKNGIARPLAGMSLSFTASLFGLAGSLVMGFLDLQAGQAQSRFYTDLENLLATRARPDAADADPALSASTRDAVARMTSLAAGDKLTANSGGERAATAAMASLAEGIQQLVVHMRGEQQMIRTWAEAQAQQHGELRRLMDRLAPDEASRGEKR